MNGPKGKRKSGEQIDTPFLAGLFLPFCKAKGWQKLKGGN